MRGWRLIHTTGEEGLFRTMRDGGYFDSGEKVPRFNGGLFDSNVAKAKHDPVPAA